MTKSTWGTCANSKRKDGKCPHVKTRKTTLCTDNEKHICPGWGEGEEK